MISERLIPKLQERFLDRGLQLGMAPGPCATFPGIHPGFGDIELYDDGDEITFCAGNFTHSHVTPMRPDLSPEQAVNDIVEQVLDLLDDVFADRIVFWGTRHGGGGWYRRGASAKRENEYVWSGPLRE